MGNKPRRPKPESQRRLEELAHHSDRTNSLAFADALMCIFYRPRQHNRIRNAFVRSAMGEKMDLDVLHTICRDHFKAKHWRYADLAEYPLKSKNGLTRRDVIEHRLGELSTAHARPEFAPVVRQLEQVINGYEIELELLPPQR